MRTVSGILLMLVAACTAQSIQPAPLVPQEVALLGCYDMEVGPWPNGGTTLMSVRVRLDSAGSTQARKITVLSGGVVPTKDVQPFTYWALLEPDSLLLRISRDLELRIQPRGDSVVGVAIANAAMSRAKVGPVRGARRVSTQGCPSK